MTPFPISAEAIAARVEAMAGEIAADHPEGEELLLIAILLGGLPFAADLGRALFRAGIDARLETIRLSSYGHERRSSGAVDLVQDLALDPAGRRILLADDVLDSGGSLAFARAHLLSRGAASVRAAVLADKQTAPDGAGADHVGFVCDRDAFLVGYGMDDEGRERFRPDIRAVD
ncbi:MAG: phosphoribosyltransferase family protein [Pseudomonadota bacterium]